MGGGEEGGCCGMDWLKRVEKGMGELGARFWRGIGGTGGIGEGG